MPGGTKETRVLTSEVLPVPGGRVSEGARQGWCLWEAGLSWEEDIFEDERQSSLENTPGCVHTWLNSRKALRQAGRRLDNFGQRKGKTKWPQRKRPSNSATMSLKQR